MPAFAIPPLIVKPSTYGFDPSAPTFSVDQYQTMIDAGTFVNDENALELLENFLVKKMPRNPIHDGTVQLVTENLRPFVPNGWTPRCQLTVVTDDSQPEPDLSIVRGTPRNYLERHPHRDDIGLIIEVANTSVERDQRDKFRIFARAGLPQYWIINLLESRIEVYTQPSGPADSPAYREFRNYHKGESVSLILDGVEVATIPVVDLLP